MRIQTPPGTAVVIRRRTWRVERTREDAGVVRLDVVPAGAAAGADRVTFLAPFDRIATGPAHGRLRRARSGRALARLALAVARIDRVRWPLAAIAADVTLLPHQLEPALAILNGARRVLIADDVGLGKTIEAGLIAAELRRRRPDARVLIAAPAGLRTQWRDELAGRFHIDARIAEAKTLERAREATSRDDNPWSRHAVWIVSLDYVKQPHVIDGLPPRAIDLLVIDEVHLACGASERHHAACLLADRARRVVLLTATPDSGRPQDRLALERIGALAGHDDPLVVFRRTRQDLRWPSTRAVRLCRVTCSGAERALLDLLSRFERAVLRAAAARHRDAAILLLSVLRKRALSTTAALALSIDRRLAYLSHDTTIADWIQPSLAFDAETDADAMSDDERAGLSAEIGLDAGRERVWLTRLARLAAVARVRESKLARIERLVHRTREPVVIFTEFRDSLDALEGCLGPGVPVAAVHGGLSAPDQARALARFTSGAARVLLATDVASQGLNLQQRARWVASLNLPWNPVRLAQRAGRVDRIGQSRPVHVTLLTSDHPSADALITRLARRVLAAQGAIAEGDLLGGSLPDEPRLRATVIAGQPIDRTEAAPFERCRRWARPASHVARVFGRRRALIARAGDRVIAGRPMLARAPRGWRHGSIAAFSVPLMNGAGDEVERHVVAVRLGAPATNNSLTRAREAAERRLERRAARVSRWVRALAPRIAARERAIASAIAPPAGPLQPGLFDRRAEQRQRDARARALDVAAQLAQQLNSIDAESSVHVGRAQLEAVVTPSRG